MIESSPVFARTFIPRLLPIFLILLAGALIGCERKKATPSPSPTEAPSSVAARLGIDAAALEPEPVDPLAPPGDLLAESEHFTTLEACVAEHGTLDPVLGDALRAIGYDTIVHDGCRLLEAIKARDKERCTPIVASALRARCESVVGIVRGDIDSCPLVRSDAPSSGRSPTCLAAATGDVRLCVGENRVGRIHCEALVLRDLARCNWLGEDASQPGMGRRTCRREVQRLRALLPPLSKGLAPLPEVSATLSVRPKIEDAGARDERVDVTHDFAQGSVLFPGELRPREVGKGRSALELGAILETGTVVFAPSPAKRPRMGLLVSIGKEGIAARAEHLELEVPGERTLVFPGDRFEGTVSIPKLVGSRGGELRVVLDGEFGVQPRAYIVHLELTTFLRDVITSAPPFRVDAGAWGHATPPDSGAQVDVRADALTPR